MGILGYAGVTLIIVAFIRLIGQLWLPIEKGSTPMSEAKYKRQAEYNRKNYVRFPLDLKPDVLEAYKAACKANGTTPTTEIKKFIAAYIEEHQATE